MKFLYSFLTYLFCSSLLLSQPDTLKSSLSDVLVTATKYPTELQNISSSYSIINHKMITQSNAPTVLQLLRDMQGISIAQQGGLGKLNSLFLRGANANHTLVLVDGVEVNDPSSPNNAFDLAHLQTENIDRIEIVRGPQSTLYGSDALAGVINVFTETGTKTNRLKLRTEGGSNSYYKGSGYFTGSFDIVEYSLNFSRLANEGFSAAAEKYGNVEADGYSNNSFSSYVKTKISDDLDFKLSYRYIDAEADLDQGGQLGDDPNYTYNVEENVLNGSFHWNLFDAKWEQKFSGSLLRRISKAIDEPNGESKLSSQNFNNATRTKFEWLNNLKLIPQNIVTIGIETELEKANSQFTSNSDFGLFESIFPSEKMRTNSLFVQDQFLTDFGLSVVAGIRYDDNDKFGGKSTYKLGGSYLNDEIGTKLKINYGTGFKAPSLFYLYDPSFGNQDLQPEESIGWDIGFEQYFYGTGISLGATYFKMSFENMFGFDQNFVTININEAETHGVETFASFVTDELAVRLAYTYTNALDLSGDSELKLLRRPDDKATLSVSYNPNERLNFNTNIRFVGSRVDEDFSTFPSTRVTLEEYTLVDFSVNYDIWENLNLFGRVENIFDADYEEVLYYGTLGRAFFAGFTFDLSFE